MRVSDSAEPRDLVNDGSLLVPEGTTVVHIGPPKTATTAVQGAFWAAREDVARQGVDYPGRSRHSAAAAIAALGRPGMFSDSDQPATKRWDTLRGEIVGSTLPRVVLSSEFLADATSDQIGPLLDQVRRANVHVVITLRPLVRIVPSHWQQSIQSGVRWSYDQWLHAMLDDDGNRALNPSFWHRHRHDQLVARWAEVVGPENVTAIVLDSKNPDLVLTSFERIVGLAAGTLVAPEDLTNRSLTWPEVEALRAFNSSLIDTGLSLGTRRRLGHAGAAHYLGASSRRIPTRRRSTCPRGRGRSSRASPRRSSTACAARRCASSATCRCSPRRRARATTRSCPSRRRSPARSPRASRPVRSPPSGVLSWDTLAVGATELPPLLPPAATTRDLERVLAGRARASVRRRWRKATSVVRRSS